MAVFLHAEAWLALLTLAILEIVLGIDNLVFISILSERVAAEQRMLARRLGLGAALVTRIALLFSINWIMRLTEPFLSAFGYSFSGRDVILVLGGIFLLAKATHEIHAQMEGGQEGAVSGAPAGLWSVVFQIAVIDIVFSLDSVVTAVGMSDSLVVMVTAVLLAVFAMLVASEPISRFVSAHPTVRMLALSFLVLIGVTLMAEGFGQHISKGYIYFVMGFSVLVEMLNLQAQKRRKGAASGVPAE